MTLSYIELLELQPESRAAFGRMLLSWRRRNGWTQYTVCTWAKEAGFEAISYGNLSVIEQGKAGELRQKVFWQLQEANRRIAEKDLGAVKNQEIKARLENAIPIGDDACPVWTALEFWGCYCGLREVPAPFAAAVTPVIGKGKAAELSSRWRKQMRRVVSTHGLDPIDALNALVAAAGPEHGKRFYAVLTGFGDYSPNEIAGLWVSGDSFMPQSWLDSWEASAGQNSQ
jgi:hypothetical protein